MNCLVYYEVADSHVFKCRGTYYVGVFHTLCLTTSNQNYKDCLAVYLGNFRWLFDNCVMRPIIDYALSSDELTNS